MKLLLINACSNKDSKTLKLTKGVIKLFENDYLIDVINTYALPFSYINDEIIEKRNNGNYDELAYKYANMIKNADRIVISAPLWDMSFPASLKVFIENIMIPNVLFRYEDDKAIGLSNAKKLLYITTIGGKVNINYGFEEIKAIANLWGINDVNSISIDLVDVIPNRFEDEKNKLINELKNKIKEF
jgi:FMN-dependent NADH-azoreductase